MRIKNVIAVLTAFSLCSAGFIVGCSSEEEEANLVASYSFDESSGSTTREAVGGKDYKIDYVFNAENADKLLKTPNDPLRRAGVKGKSLYMDGFSNSITNTDFKAPTSAMTLSAWVAPRVFENLSNYSDGSDAEGNTRLTAIINKGDVGVCEGFVLGYGRLGLWGVQLALRNTETDDEYVVAFYDPVNTLPLYEWSHLTVTFDGTEGYIALYYNGALAYETVAEELVGTRIIASEEPLYIGRYTNPMIEYGINRQMVGGLLDEIKIYKSSLTAAEVKGLYADTDFGGAHPSLNWSEVAIDSTIYGDDRYRPQYHALPPAVWMNEPHAPFYYNGKYHVFYQHNPSGPYWAQLRWGHIVGDDMIHWEYVKDAVVPTAGICPEGVWTGGACIGPDGTPWLAITAGTNTTSWSDQNIAFAHPADINDPYLTDWVLEDKVAITQPSNDAQGERGQFRDPFVWRDGDTYYMLVSTSIPGAGGSANVYTSKDMRNWVSRGYLFECDYELYPEQGEHFECVIMLPVSTGDGRETKYVLFDCPQYLSETATVECYYWIGTFDKEACRFIPDDEKPQLFDRGRGVFTGQNGFCFNTESGSDYEHGRTVIYAIAQGKDAGTAQNLNAGWAHNFAIPLELRLSDDGKNIIREPIKELQSVRGEKLYSIPEGQTKTAFELNSEISNLRGDMLEITAEFTISPTVETYSAGLSVRYNPNTVDMQTERTDLVFSDAGVYVDRSQSSLLDYVSKQPSHTWEDASKKYSVTVLLDRSMLEVYVNGIMSFTTRIYPKYGNSDYLHVFDNDAKISFTSFTVYRMGSAYSDEVKPSYYGNVGNLGN